MALALNCGIPSTPQGRELVQHGSALFPIACYEERLTCYSVPWHWHEDFEYILAYEGTVTVGVDKKRICLAEGEGVFINSGVLHAVEFAAEGPSVLRSGVFHPRLVGGMDTIYWQKLIRPLLQPGVPSYFLLSKGEPWQAEVLARLWEAAPVINTVGIRDAGGNWYGENEALPEELEAAVEDYRVLLYNHVFDKKNRVEGFFTLTE